MQPDLPPKTAPEAPLPDCVLSLVVVNTIALPVPTVVVQKRPSSPSATRSPEAGLGFLTREEDAAVTLVGCCFGGTSPEWLQFVRYLVEQVHGLPWIEVGLDVAELREAHPHVNFVPGVDGVVLVDPQTPGLGPCGELLPGSGLAASAAQRDVDECRPEHFAFPAGKNVSGDVFKVEAHEVAR